MKKIMFNDRYGLTQAVLDGRKTMTRRFVPPRFYENILPGVFKEEGASKSYYKVGEVVAVAQAYKDIIGDHVFFVSSETGVSVHRAVMEKEKGWTNKMFVASEFMPNRIRITDIKAKRLQDISEADCLKEGIIDIITPVLYPCGNHVYTFKGNKGGAWFGKIQGYRTAKEAFSRLIDNINGICTWERNPWVIAYTFELLKEDQP